ncbi:hypothetical protein [Sandarakinorhabdus oryzae]|uniref:hypothetical protein n=1 Tax=Sandarakinorhabdus oryzae TaxID=2675220 RepID=UPI0012E1D81D|nr:hypothetical protein [Sandarakinorhabdus oryzae]
MKFASFGRQTDRNHIIRYVSDPEAQILLLEMTDAVHDLNDGVGDVDQFISRVRDVLHSRFGGARENALMLLSRVARYHPECNVIWRELMQSPSWQMRFAVACRLYWHVPEDLSDRFFAILRNDKSKRVREIAVSRYENRADENGEIVIGRYDAAKFDDRVRRGELKIIGEAEF